MHLVTVRGLGYKLEDSPPRNGPYSAARVARMHRDEPQSRCGACIAASSA